jgi:hypothetical protein
MKLELSDILSNFLTKKFSQIKMSGKDFEDCFEQELILNGIQKINFSFDKEIKKTIMASDTLIPNTFNLYGYVREPFNTQSFPDFIVFDKNYLIPIEIKSSKDTDKPMWNNSLPKQYATYIFMAYAENLPLREVVYFMGKDVITKDCSDIFATKMKEVQKAAKLSKEELSLLDKHKYGWNTYVRVNYQQSIHALDTCPSFVNNPNKLANNQNVIRYLKSLS